ncbi:MAG: RNA pseudouridylate synthase [marine bacterium B5-7]|nr:MAG: RNA pseudouridylate synthase [marine bacterium B5-7]
MAVLRLSKYLAQMGLCSRREADRYIADGRVRVDGEIIREAWFRVEPSHNVVLDASAQSEQAARGTVLINKPLGYVSGQPEPGYKSAVTLVSSDTYAGEGKAPKVHDRSTLAPAGRLDINSTGLLVMTADGRVARQLIGNDVIVEKEYLVRHTGKVSEPQLKMLRHGLSLDGRALKPAKVNQLNDDQLRFILIEGRKRQIRRMCDEVGVNVTALKRVRIGGVKLGKLPLGTWRELRPDESF